MNKEVELKIQIDNVDLQNVQGWLHQNAKHVDEVIKHTEYYLNKPSTSFFFIAPEGYKDALDYLRVRITKKWRLFLF